VVVGVVLILWLTGTTANLQSFMGSIMSIGVAVANAILLVTFAEQHRREERMDARLAAVEGAQGRLRPILMTSCAMIAGMVPMSLGLTEGGEQTAPLARAVIGGLLAATIATLTVLPTVFALVQGWSGRESASLDPDDPSSAHYHEEEDEARKLARPSANGEPEIHEPQASPGGPGLPSDRSVEAGR
jgi:Cu/Ag efflux pump CusA